MKMQSKFVTVQPPTSSGLVADTGNGTGNRQQTQGQEDVDRRDRERREDGQAEDTDCFQPHYPEREIPQNDRLFLNGTGRKKTHCVQTVLRPVPGISCHFGNFSAPDKSVRKQPVSSARPSSRVLLFRLSDRSFSPHREK